MSVESSEHEVVIDVDISESREDRNWVDSFTARMMINASVGGLFRVKAKTNSGKEDTQHGRQ